MPNEILNTFTLADGSVFQLRSFKRVDVPFILLLEKKLNPSPWKENHFLEAVEKNQLCIGIKVNDRWVAYAVFRYVAGDLEVLILGVEPGFQRKGLASKLVSFAEEYYEGKVEQIFLEVRESNSEAIALYEKLGFNCMGCRENYYLADGGREDALLYGKTL